MVAQDVPSQPPKPLKILTIDGGGLQAISSLVILNNLLEAIGKQHGPPDRKPRPCDVFDTIAGIGAGGWLAILLGRFRMDITTCLYEWYRITQCIAPRSTTEALRMRLLRHCYFDTHRLLEQVDVLSQLYGTGDLLFEPEPNGARTRHVFVAALASDGRGYNLFRSYEIPTSAKLPKKLLDGPEDPSKFKISSAFGVTGAARYFTNPWKERIARNGKIRFSDTKFPKPHNITELALDEMWGIYGTEVPMSVVVNIGPGLPNDTDVKWIAKRFSWGLPMLADIPTSSRNKHKPPVTEKKSQSEQKSLPVTRPNCSNQDDKRNSVRLCENTAEQNPDCRWGRTTTRTNTFGSSKARSIDTKLERLENVIEDDIKQKLAEIYPDNPPLYARLAPPSAPQGTSQNDSFASGVTLNATQVYLSEPRVEIAIDDVVKRIPDTITVC